MLLVEAGYSSFLPLHAAPYPGPDGKAECLADWIEITRVPAVSMLAHCEARSKPRGFVGVGDSLTSELPELKWAQWELESARSYFVPSRYFQGIRGDATLANLRREFRSDCVLHLAVHTTTSEGALSFAFTDAIVPVSQLSKLLPSAPHLVVAAGCSSSRLDLGSNLDDAVGLSSDLMASGCPVVFGTLWPVDDIATALLVSRFYRNYMEDAKDPTSSLADATRWLRKLTRLEVLKIVGDLEHVDRGFVGRLSEKARAWASDLQYPFADPAYWGAFVVHDLTVEGSQS